MDTLVLSAKISNFKEAILDLDKNHEDAFYLSLPKMYNLYESYSYKWSGLFLRTSGVIAQIPFKGSKINMTLALSRLLVCLSERMSSDELNLLLQCFEELSLNIKFRTRGYSFLAYNLIPKKIFYNLCPEASTLWI